MTLAEIRQRLRDGGYRLSEHALARVVQRNIAAEMIRQAGENAEMIEDYPEDKYAPSCLILGFCHDGTPLHMHVSRAEGPTVKIVTLYSPDPAAWIDHRVRRSQS